MMEIALAPLPAQTIKTVVSGQKVELFIRQKPVGLLIDVVVNGTTVEYNCLGQDCVPFVLRTYGGIEGNFMFVDTQGNSNPDSDSLGSRYRLVYLTADEYELL